ncbi:sugar phosphate isomerase/epimerase family protein [Armatimonas sp.]|uniref:sugar phosphate isomerase/epimerase family protein n=1 Tax=Armatimonas sp. TaxID=1872638 RepID=UPI0037518320
MKISIAGYSVHGLLSEGKIDIFGYLESCRYRFGLATADIWNGLLPTLDDDFIRKVRHSLDERELTLVNYHADGCHVWEDSPEARARNRALAFEHLKVAAALGAKTVRIDTGGKLERMTAEQLTIVSDQFREYCAFGQEHGFSVGPETHWGISLIADNMEEIAKTVAHPAYGILLHIGHWEQGDPDEGDRRLAPYAVHTHVDAKITRTYLFEKMQLLLNAGYTGYWGVEHHSKQNEYAEIALQLAMVRKVLSQLLWEQQRGESLDAASVKTGNPLLTDEQEGRASK